MIDKVQPDDVYLAGEEITVNAPVKGDLVIAGGTLMVNDSIHGDFTGAGGDLSIVGPIADDVRVAGGKITIDSNIGDDLVVFGGEVNITQNAQIKGKLICFAGDVIMNGEVGEDLEVRGGELSINGTVRGNSKIISEDIIIGSNAKFHQDVEYYSDTEELDFKSSLVNAKAEYNEDLADEQSQLSMTTFGTRSLKSWIFYVLSAFLGILVFHALFRHTFSNAAEGLENNLLKSFGYGLIYLIGIPLLILVALLMLIGLKLGLFATAVFVFSLLFGHAIASILIAYYLGDRYDKNWGFWTITFLALACAIALRLFTMTPYLGILLSVVILAITYGALTLHTIWVGTGENVGGRHVAFGDGIYVSHDDGATWKNMGLKNSEHLSKIIVHPEDSNTIWAVSQGPLWTAGGERGVYKSIDGGKSWNRTLGDDQWVGATDMVIDPRNPDILYTATWQRHRTVAGYLGGVPGSGLHKSTDGGETWTELTKGIPKSNLGKIGLAISPFNPDVIYAAIELDRRKGGVFMSTNRGLSWKKQSDAISGGTGPHYYQELYASPHHEGKLFLMSNYVQISDDHGKTFKRMNEKNKHVDSHAVAFKASDPNYILFGTDGGLYETFDLTKSWKYIRNLPITQYFKVAVDDSEPFYKIYGGAQDNGSHGGPSQTMYSDGIANGDWWKTLGADGHQSATEPGNPNITYGEFQQGVLWRIDQTTKETVFIQPQAREGEPYERFNWDAPILVSPHNPKRLYFASQRVWRSDNRGDDWTPISNDLTLNQDRMTIPYYGKQQSWDNAWDVYAMSNYNTITSLSESPKQEGLIYAGTDDGIIQTTEDGGNTWRKFSLSSIKGLNHVPFVNDVRADLFDANTVYAAVDNHKYGDYKPCILKSTDKGRSWKMMNGDLPEPLLVWRLVQDHVDRDLLFAATEYGIYFTYNGGNN